ncbi:MAG: hypothetical protein AAGH40_10620 [Verrucomicrobiota bacterium]
MMIQAKFVCCIVGVLSAICLCALITLQLLGNFESESPPVSATERQQSAISEKSIVLPEPIPAHLTSPMAQRLGAVDSNAMDDLVALHEMIRFYAMEIDQPLLLGTNQEITRGLLVKDDLGRAMLSSNHPSINARGELIDRWETPFFFHAQSSSEVEVISAGPDKKFSTEDDLTWPQPAVSTEGFLVGSIYNVGKE